MSAIVRLDRVNDRQVSITFASDLENGSVVKLGAKASDGESFVALASTAVTTDTFYFVSSVPLLEEEPKGLKDFVLKAGDKGRAYKLEVGDEITITDDGFTGTSAVGKYLIPVSGSVKMAVADNLIGDTSLAFEITESTTLGIDGTSASTLLVVKA